MFYVNADFWFLSLLLQSAINFDLIVLSESLLMSRCFSWRWLAAHSITPPDKDNLVVWMLPLLTSLKHPRLPTAVRDSCSVNSPAYHQLWKSCSVNLALVTHPDLGEGNSLTSPKPKIVWCEHGFSCSSFYVTTSIMDILLGIGDVQSPEAKTTAIFLNKKTTL